MTNAADRRRRDDSRQDEGATAKNAEFFANNAGYKQAQKDFELYRLIALAAAHETRQSRALLDIGNGGLFEYPIDHIPRVVAIDVFVEDDFAIRYPRVDWRKMSALEMEFDETFDTVIAINTLHHVVGSSVAATYSNLDEIMRRARVCLAPDGRLVIIESTMPRWFVAIYRRCYGWLLRVWPLEHPPTFQFYFREIISAATRAGFELSEVAFVPKTSDFIFLGRRVKRWMAPIQVAKFVFGLPRVFDGRERSTAS